MRGRLPGLVAILLALSTGTGAAQTWGTPAPAQVDAAARLSRADADLASARLRSEQAKSDEARAKAEIAGLEERASIARQSMRERIRALYRIRRAGALPVAGGFTALLSHIARLERLERIVRADVDAVRFLDERRAGLEAEVARAQRAREAAERDESALAEARRSLELEMGRYAYLSPGSLPSLPVAPLPEELSYGTLRVVDAAPLEPIGFAALHGRLGTPVRAPSTVRDAVRDDGPGLELLAPAGTPVFAAAEGRVAFARTYGSYGRVVILDHGAGYYTVYGGLGRVDARVGDPIAAGGSIGNVGVAQEPALFFEVRQGTRSLDARAWLGMR